MNKINRLQYLDWVRGLAAAIMLFGHAFHAYLKPELRAGNTYNLTQFLGGMPPAIFLFLTGVTFAFMMDSQERKNPSLFLRWTTALRRAGYLFLIAFAFRLQLWLFSLPGPLWSDLLRVDILNCMGFSMLLLSPMAFFTTRERVRFCAIVGVAVALASPIVSSANWSWTPLIFQQYVVPNHNFFSYFPWAAFLAFGVSAGSLLRLVHPLQTERVMQWGAILGGILILSSQYLATLPFSLYPASDFWLNSPWQVFTKVGVIVMIVPAAWLWNTFGAAEGWSPLRQLGITSLLVYWVHIELVYGRWTWFWKDALDVTSTAFAALALIVLMLALSYGKTRYTSIRTALSNLFARPTDAPSVASGD